MQDDLAHTRARPDARPLGPARAPVAAPGPGSSCRSSWALLQVQLTYLQSMLRPDFVPLDFKAFDLRVPLHGLISSNSDSGSGSGSGASSPPSAVARRPDDAGPSAAAASTATIASTTSSAESTVTRSLPLNHIVYVLTGVMQVLLVQYLHYEGAAGTVP